jgi:hypothetical protein
MWRAAQLPKKNPLFARSKGMDHERFGDLRLLPDRQASPPVARERTMSKRKMLSDHGWRPMIADFTQEDFERFNRLTHAKNLRSIIKATKWLNDHGVELIRQYPEEFRSGTGMTVEEYLSALTAHVERCRAFLERM